MPTNPTPPSEPASELVKQVARAIEGPHRPVPNTGKWSLDELRAVRWRMLPCQEQAERMSQAASVLALPALAERADMARLQGETRKAVARCIEIAREVRDGFLSPDYATDQPLSSFNERFACAQVAEAIENEFAIGTNEQRQLLGKPTPLEEYRASDGNAK